MSVTSELSHSQKSAETKLICFQKLHYETLNKTKLKNQSFQRVKSFISSVGLM